MNLRSVAVGHGRPGGNVQVLAWWMSFRRIRATWDGFIVLGRLDRHDPVVEAMAEAPVAKCNISVESPVHWREEQHEEATLSLSRKGVAVSEGLLQR